MNVQLPDFSVAYTDVGQGIPLLFIHGYPLNRQLWQPQAEGLSQTARILAPDLRGHGESQATPGPYSMSLLADDLSAFLDALRVNQRVISLRAFHGRVCSSCLLPQIRHSDGRTGVDSHARNPRLARSQDWPRPGHRQGQRRRDFTHR